MLLFITGGTGLIGRRLVLDRLERGDRVIMLTRRRARAEEHFPPGPYPSVEVVEGDPTVPGEWQSRVDGCDAVVHLAGASLADRRWTPPYRQLLIDSRVDGTHQVVEAIRGATRKPGVLVCASAVGWYGETRGVETDETAPAQDGDFLADLSKRWETQAATAEELGTRVVHARLGVVLDARGGIVARLVPPFRMFVGGPIGAGRQYLPWIHWRDVVGLADLCLRDGRVRGPINFTAPTPVTNRRFSRALGRSLRRPSWAPVPPFVLRLVLGELAQYALMSQRVVPTRAREHGYRFVYSEIEPALDAILRSRDRDASPASPRPVTTPGRSAAPSPSLSPTLAPPLPGPATAIRLLALGLDGALLHAATDARPDSSLAAACRAAQSRGCAIVAASAQPPRAVRSVVRALQIVGPMITYNGAVIWNPVDERPQYHEELDGALALEIVASARAVAPELLVGVEVLDRWFTDRVDPAWSDPPERAIVPDGIGPLEQFMASPITQLNLYGTPECIRAARVAIDDAYWRTRSISLFQPEPTILQIMSPLVDKSIALQRIAARSAIQRASVMVIGDVDTDLGMMEWAGFAVTSDAASPAVKALAQAVVPGAENLVAAHAVEQYVLARPDA